MHEFFDFLLDFLAQYGGGRGGDENELVRFSLAGVFWGLLIFFAYKKRRQGETEREKLLIWGFGFGFIRELFMFIVVSFRMTKIIDPESLHVVFPPLEHALSMAAIIIIAAAFLRYVLRDFSLSTRYLQLGIGATIICYLSTFWWWAGFILENPSSEFGQTWADWIFRITASIFIAFPIFVLIKNENRNDWLSKVVAIALSMFFMGEFLMLFNLASKEVYKGIYGPIRHNLHIWAILLLGYVYIKEMYLEREEAMKRLKDESEITASLLRFSEILNTAFKEKSFIENLIHIIPKYIKSERIGILLYEDNHNGFVVRGLSGFASEEEKILKLKTIKKGDFKEIDTLIEGFSLIFNHSRCDIGLSEGFIETFGIKRVVLFPVFVNKEVKAILLGGNKSSSFIDSKDIVLLKGFADELSISLQNLKLYEDLQQLLIGSITAFVSALDAKSHWTKGHSERVTNYAVAIGMRMGLSEKEIERLRLAGLLHDIGKIGTYDHLLNKPDKLTPEEFEIVKKHTSHGASIIESIKELNDIVPIIKYHHERIDGKGYPDGLKGDEIPLLARILHVADTYDAITADRPYRKSPGKEFAIEEIKRCSGTQFDPEVVRTFIRVCGENQLLT
jgi:putative nucleotidyltransferase with HDIG domain